MSPFEWIIIGALFLYVSYSVEKRVSAVAKTGFLFSQSFSVDAEYAVSSNRFFGKLAGIKSAMAGKSFDKWNSKEKEVYRQSYARKTFVRLTYLATEDAFFVSPIEGRPYVVLSRGKTEIFSRTIIGNEFLTGDGLEFVLVDRTLEGKKGKRTRILTAYLKERYADVHTEPKIHILFDYPFMGDLEDGDLQALGFEIERRESHYEHKDEFGETAYYPDLIQHKRNGATIRL